MSEMKSAPLKTIKSTYRSPLYLKFRLRYDILGTDGGHFENNGSGDLCQDFFQRSIKLFLVSHILSVQQLPHSRFLDSHRIYNMNYIIISWKLMDIMDLEWDPRWPPFRPHGTIFGDGNIKILKVDTLRIVKR